MIVNAAKHEIALNHIKDTYKYIRIGNGGDDTAASQTALDAEIPQSDGSTLVKTVTPSVIGNQLVWTVSFTGTEIGTQGASELGIFSASSGGTLLRRATFTNTGVVPSTDTVTFTIRVEVD